MIEVWDKNLPENEGRTDGRPAGVNSNLLVTFKFSSLKPCT